MKGKIIISLLAALMVLASCRKDREYYILELEHPGQIAIPDDIDLPVDIIIIDEDDDDETEVEPGDEVDVETGRYKLVVMKNSTGIVRKGVVASLPAASGGEVPSDPALLADVVTVIVYENKITIPAINLKPMTREVQIRVGVEGVAPANISSVRATLHGVANTLNMEQGFGAVSGSANHYCTVQMQGYAADNTMSMRIFGIVPGVSPTITIEVATTKGDVHRLELDVSSVLKNFNTGTPTQQVLLYAQLTVKTGAGVTGTIKPWKPGWEEEIEGHEY